MSRPPPITLEDCQSLFYLPVAKAAQLLGVSRPTISKILRANGIKRWPYRKLRAQGKIDVLRQRHQHNLSATNLPILPPLPQPPPPPPPPPLPPFMSNPINHPSPPKQEDQSGNTEPLFSQPPQTTPDDETYILQLLDHPLSPQHFEDHTHPILSLEPNPIWTCNEQLSTQDPHDPHPLSPTAQSPPPQISNHQHQNFHPDTRSHTISTVRPAARAVFGSGNWSRGVFRQDGDRMSFAFLPMPHLGSSLSDEDPLNHNTPSQL